MDSKARANALVRLAQSLFVVDKSNIGLRGDIDSENMLLITGLPVALMTYRVFLSPSAADLPLRVCAIDVITFRSLPSR
jgi:hypothetical protein